MCSDSTISPEALAELQSLLAEALEKAAKWDRYNMKHVARRKVAEKFRMAHDPAYRAKQNAKKARRHNERYATDPAYRARIIAAKKREEERASDPIKAARAAYRSAYHRVWAVSGPGPEAQAAGRAAYDESLNERKVAA